jgi:hypothetical protein
VKRGRELAVGTTTPHRAATEVACEPANAVNQDLHEERMPKTAEKKVATIAEQLQAAADLLARFGDALETRASQTGDERRKKVMQLAAGHFESAVQQVAEGLEVLRGVL